MGISKGQTLGRLRGHQGQESVYVTGLVTQSEKKRSCVFGTEAEDVEGGKRDDEQVLKDSSKKSRGGGLGFNNVS